MSGTGLVTGLLDFRRLDVIAAGDSPLHRIDARAKVLVTLVFVVCVMSFDRYAVAPLMPFFVFPVVMLARGGLPAGYVVRKVALVVPVALVVALPNLWFDRQPLLTVGTWTLSGGAVSVVSILLRSLLATAAAILLVAVTGFAPLCAALERLGMPRALTVQLLFLYRYLTVLGEEAVRMTSARELRSEGRALALREYGPLVGRLLLRTWDRAEHIHLAMCARGFDGDLRRGPVSRWGAREWGYVAAWCALFVGLRMTEVSRALGDLALGGPR